MSNPVVWFEVMGQDADKLRSFYTQLLGWKFKIDNPTNYGVVESAEASLTDLLTALSPKHPELVAIVTVWPELPEVVRAGIVAMVEASKPEGSAG